jgi:DNA invertase Pin-like site-specific DNA recombinase
MRVGYVRCSEPRSIADTTRRLDEAGCARILMDAADGGSGRTAMEPLKALISTLNPGDRLTVLRLDHLAPMPGLVAVLADLVDGGVVVESLDDRFSTEAAGVRAGLMALGRYMTMPAPAGESKARGRHRVLNEKAIERARDMIEEQGMSVVDVAAAMSVSRATIYRHLGSERALRRAPASRRVLQRVQETA